MIAAITLYNNVPKNRKEFVEAKPVYHTKEQYLAKGKEIYEWGVKNLFDKNTGRIADSKHDPQGLIDLMGGKESFNQMMDSVFLLPPVFDDSYYGGVIHDKLL